MELSPSCWPKISRVPALAANATTKRMNYGMKRVRTRRAAAHSTMRGCAFSLFLRAKTWKSFTAASTPSKDKTHPDAKECQVWTDTWLKRGGKWQIVAAQDNKIDCK